MSLRLCHKLCTLLSAQGAAPDRTYRKINIFGPAILTPPTPEMKVTTPEREVSSSRGGGL